jgi:hypothetical protein
VSNHPLITPEQSRENLLRVLLKHRALLEYKPGDETAWPDGVSRINLELGKLAKLAFNPEVKKALHACQSYIKRASELHSRGLRS